MPSWDNEIDRPDPFDHSDTIRELQELQAWNEERNRNADVARLQGIDRQIRDRHTAEMMKALSPAARRARAEQMRHAFDLSGITRQLQEMAPDSADSTDRSHTAAKALNPAYFAAAWRTLASAEAAGEATPDQLRKAADHLHGLQYGSMMQDVELGDTARARDHLRQLVVTGGFATAEEAARHEFALNNGSTIAKARTPYTGPPALAQVVLSGDWGAIPPAGHQKR
jgi:hypothetical protein